MFEGATGSNSSDLEWQMRGELIISGSGGGQRLAQSSQLVASGLNVLAGLLYSDVCPTFQNRLAMIVEYYYAKSERH
jgi:hypothetical protein